MEYICNHTATHIVRAHRHTRTRAARTHVRRHTGTRAPTASSICVCVCARARARVRVDACVRLRHRARLCARCVFRLVCFRPQPETHRHGPGRLGPGRLGPACSRLRSRDPEAFRERGGALGGAKNRTIIMRRANNNRWAATDCPSFFITLYRNILTQQHNQCHALCALYDVMLKGAGPPW